MRLSPIIPLLLLTAAALAAAPASSNNSPSASSAQTAPSTAPTHWSAIIQRLGSDSFEEREAAQQELARADYHQLFLLQQVAAQTQDDEIRVRLQVRIATIREEIAANPPPIDLTIKDATLPQVLFALSKSTGFLVPTDPDPLSPQWQSKFSLDVHEKTFWQIFADLSAQHPLRASDWENFQLSEAQGMSRPITFGLGGIVAIFPGRITYGRIANYQNAPADQLLALSLSFAYTVAVDPRICLTQATVPSFTDIRDDLGNTLLNRPPDTTNFSFSGKNGFVHGDSIALSIPKNLGTKIASAQGQMNLTIEIASIQTAYDAPDTLLNTPLPIGDRSVQINNYQPNDHGFQMSFIISQPADRKQMGKRFTPTPHWPIKITLLDADGHILYSRANQDTADVTAPHLKRPMKLILSTATKVTQVAIPFELKDLPLPRH